MVEFGWKQKPKTTANETWVNICWSAQAAGCWSEENVSLFSVNNLLIGFFQHTTLHDSRYDFVDQQVAIFVDQKNVLTRVSLAWEGATVLPRQGRVYKSSTAWSRDTID